MYKWHLAYSPYELEFSQSREKVRGVVLRLQGEQGTRYGVLQSWPDLDGYSFDRGLQDLENLVLDSHFLKPALEQALRFGASELLPDKNSVKSHLLGGTAENYCDDVFINAIEGGFKSLKFKIHRNLNMEILKLFSHMSQFPSDVRLRLDFNLKFSAREVDLALSKLTDEERLRIDFIEDPFAGTDLEWQQMRDKYGVEFATDWYRPVETSDSEAFSFLDVCKPNLLSQSKDPKRSLLVTSYMAHPLEQLLAQAFAEGQRTKLLEFMDSEDEPIVYAGCASHLIYRYNPYSKLIKLESSVVQLEDKKSFFDLLNKEKFTDVGVFEDKTLLGG